MGVIRVRRCMVLPICAVLAVVFTCVLSLLSAGRAEALDAPGSQMAEVVGVCPVQQAESKVAAQAAIENDKTVEQAEEKVELSSTNGFDKAAADNVKATNAVNDVDGAKESVLVAQSSSRSNTVNNVSKTVAAEAKASAAQTTSKPNTGKGDLAPGKYFVVSALSSYQVVDVCGASKGDGANVVAWRGSGDANQQWSVAIDKEGYAVLTSVNSGKVLDVEGGRAIRGANVIQYKANNGKNQKWIVKKYNNAYVLISALNNSLVLDLTGKSANNGTNVEIWTRNNEKNQLFQFIPVTPTKASPGSRVLSDGVYTMKATSAKNTVVDVQGGSTANGANALTWSASGAAWQAWYLAYDNAGYYIIASVNSGRQLAPAAVYGLNGINVGQYSLGNVDRAKWRIAGSNGQYTLVNKATGTALNASSLNKDNSANVQMGLGTQKFTISSQAVIPTGAVLIEVAANTGLALDVYNSSMAKNAKLGTWNESGNLNQRFLVTAYKNGYTIRPFNSRMYLTASSAGVLTQEAARANMQNQVWNISANRGLVTFVNATTGKAIAVSGNAAKASATITTTSSANSASAQKFYMRAVPAVSNGTYYISLNSNASMVLDVVGGNRKNDANLELWQKNSGNNQRFVFTALGGGLYKISNVATTRVLDVAGASTKAGANVAMYKWGGGNNQKWRIEFNDDFSLKITSAQTGYSLDTAKSSAAKGANVIVNAVNAKSATQKYWISETWYGSEVVQIGVPCYMQNPELPTGCESVALTNALRYYGYSLGKTTIADSYMPYGSNGVYDFIGSPYNDSGWIICAPGITNTANSYLSRAGGSVIAKNVSGTSLSALRTYLDRGQPVMVWTTMWMGDPGSVQWYSSGYPLRSNNHAVVLTGYNPFDGYYQVADSLSGVVWREGGRFEYLYNEMGRQAVVLEG